MKLTLYVAVTAGILLATAVTGVVVQTKRLEAEKVAFADFRADVREKGRAAAEAARAKAADDKRRKEQIDDQHAFEVGVVRRDSERLRRALASRSLVPAAPATSSRPDLACFNRAELDGALRGFAEGARGLVGEGDESTVGLNAGKRSVGTR